MPAPLPPTVLDRARSLLDDGASYRQAAETVQCSRSTLQLHLPGYGWTYREGGQFRAAVRSTERLMRRQVGGAL